MSPSVIARLRGEWEADHARWQGRDLSARRCVCVWAAETAIATSADKYGAKHEKAVACLVKDRDALLIFHDLPAEH